MRNNIFKRIAIIGIAAFMVISVFIGSLRAYRHDVMISYYDLLIEDGYSDIEIISEYDLVKGSKGNVTMYYDCTNPIFVDCTKFTSY